MTPISGVRRGSRSPSSRRCGRRGAVPSSRPGRCVEQQPRADVAHLLVDGRARVEQRDRDGQLVDDVAGVGAGVEQHHGVAGDCLAAQDRPVDRRVAAVVRQQRGVKAHAAAPWHGEQLRFDELVPAHHHDQVRSQGPHRRHDVRVVGVVGAHYRHPARRGGPNEVDGTGSPRRPGGRRGHDGGDLDQLAGQQRVEGRSASCTAPMNTTCPRALMMSPPRSSRTNPLSGEGEGRQQGCRAQVGDARGDGGPGRTVRRDEQQMSNAIVSTTSGPHGDRVAARAAGARRGGRPDGRGAFDRRARRATGRRAGRPA